MRGRFAVLMTGFLCLALPAMAQDDRAALVSRTIPQCESCHGKGGDSTQASVPRLNGQQADYIAARLKSFRDVTRQTPHATYMMWGVATNVSDEIIASLAQYFAGQPARPASGLSDAGKTLYLQGAGDVPACQSCHGAQGEGSGVTPRLAGQHPEYLADQLDAFELTARVHDTMNDRTWPLTADQIKAVSSYLGRP